MTAAHDTQALLRQALNAMESCGAGAVEDGGQQWFDDKLVDAAHDAIESYLASRLQEQEGQPALSEKEAFMRTLGWQPRATLAAGSQAVQVPERISELIDQHGSLRAAARALDCDPGYLSRLQSGEKSDPGTELLSRMGLRQVIIFERTEL